MKKSEVLFKIIPANFDTSETMKEAGYTMEVDALNPNGNGMLDEHISEHFPELEELGLEEVQEGAFGYCGDLTADQMKAELRNLGFKVQ